MAKKVVQGGPGATKDYGDVFKRFEAPERENAKALLQNFEREATDERRGVTSNATLKELYERKEGEPDPACAALREGLRTPEIVVPTAANILTSLDLSVAATIDRHRKLIQHGDYYGFGLLERIQLGNAGIPNKILQGQQTTRDGRPTLDMQNVHEIENPLIEQNRMLKSLGKPMRSASIDWKHDGPLIARSRDDKELLLIPPVMHPPPLPDPFWDPPKLYNARGEYVGDKLVNDPLSPAALNRPKGKRLMSEAPLVAQHLSWFSWGVLEINTTGEKFMVFQPITEMMMLHQTEGNPSSQGVNRPMGGGQLRKPEHGGFMTAKSGPDAQGKCSVLLWNPKTLEGFILFGRWSDWRKF